LYKTISLYLGNTGRCSCVYLEGYLDHTFISRNISTAISTLIQTQVLEVPHGRNQRPSRYIFLVSEINIWNYDVVTLVANCLAESDGCHQFWSWRPFNIWPDTM